MESLVLPADIDNGHIGPTDPHLQNDSAVVSASFSNLNCLSSFRNYQKKKKKKKKSGKLFLEFQKELLLQDLL